MDDDAFINWLEDATKPSNVVSRSVILALALSILIKVPLISAASEELKSVKPLVFIKDI